MSLICKLYLYYCNDYNYTPFIDSIVSDDYVMILTAFQMIKNSSIAST